MQVFYGPDCLPYKDSARSVHYPIIGNSFLGASNTTQIRFYVRDIGGVNNVSWVAVSKLPNGQIGSQVLSSIQLDSELNEYYVALDLSSYYTQLKGDVYISLNGYQGGIQVIHDEETDIYNITGTPIIEATGAIKLAINYAPQLPLGKHFQIDDLQQILGLVSQKANIINTIQVVANITLEDLSYYSSGQLFYDLNSKTYYRYNGSTYQVVDTFGILANEKTLVRYNVATNTNLMSLFQLFLTRLVCVNLAGLDYLVQFGSANSFCAFKLSTREFFVPTVTPLTTFGNAIENQYKITYVEKKTTNNTVYAINNNGEQIMLPYSASVLYDALVLRTASGQVKVPSAPVSNDDATSKAYVDSIDQALRDLIDTIIKNAFILVDTDEYPTLEDFEESTGQEGFIYLYPVDLSNPSLGYYQLIWENNDWLDLGTTQIDLSDYYTKEEIDDIHKTINNDIPKHQATTILIVDPLTNINGRTFQTYTSQNVTIGGRPAVKILHNGNRLNEQQAKEYMEYMTGSYFLPKYNYDYPKNTYFIMPDGQLLKPQYDSTNGLLLYISGQIATKSYIDTELAKKVDKTNSGEKVYGTDELGAQTTYDVDSDLVGSGAIVRRETSTGTVVVGTPTSNTHATTKQYVDNSISNAISNVYRIKGSKTVAQINALTGMSTGDVYNLLDSGTIVLGNLQVFTGDNIVWTGSAWDKLGAEIDWSAYDEKFIAAGFFEVQPYNDSTGEITIVYSTELYIMSYDADTGIMTIQAN